MVRAKSIPPEHEQTVIDMYLTGRSYRAIAEHLVTEHHIETTHASVARAIDRVSDGACSASALATMLRLRREAPAVADRMVQILDIMCAQAGLPSSHASREVAPIDYGKADRAHRLMERHLRLAGCTGAAAERTLEKYERVVGAAGQALHENEPSVATLRLEKLERTDAVATPEILPFASAGASRVERLNEAKSPEKAAVQPSTSPAAVALPPMSALRVVAAQESPADAAPQKEPTAERIAPLPKVGRNEHCPCGSGRKYKKCCEPGTVSGGASTPTLAVG